MQSLLSAPGETLRIIRKYDIHARKKYGQNFLVDGNIIDRIVESAGVTEDDCVLEVGPGIGTMTQMLSRAAGQVVSVEIDTTLEPVLAETLEGCDNVTIIWNDILKCDIREICEKYNHGKPLKVVANLPYYVTTPILMKLLEEKGCFESITVMVQKEVADRICSPAGRKEYGAISLAVQYYSEPRIAVNVSPSCFIPRPNVDSCVLHLRAYEKPPVEADEALRFALIRASFNQRRKTLSNALSHGLSQSKYAVSREEVDEALVQMGKSKTERGEQLTLEEFCTLSKLLAK